MTGEFRLIRVSPAAYARLASQILSPETKLLHLKNVTRGVMQDALSTRDDLWAELQDSVTSAVMALPESEKGFKPSCGWPEFLEKMWLVRRCLDFSKKFCKQNAQHNGFKIESVFCEKARPKSEREQ
jgi:hypothetical protein